MYALISGCELLRGGGCYFARLCLALDTACTLRVSLAIYWALFAPIEVSRPGQRKRGRGI